MVDRHREAEAMIVYWWWIGIGVGAVVLAGAVWWAWWQLPKRVANGLRLKIRDAKARIDIEDNFRKTIGQALGAIAVLIGAGFALAQFLAQRDTAQQQITVSQKQVEISQQQVQASHDLRISQQVAKGFEQLGSDRLMIRLGGIYALEGAMNGSEPYHQAVLEALCAFVREGSKTGSSDGPPATDIYVALGAILRRQSDPRDTIDLAHASIPKANLFQADLIHATLTDANLTGANLSYADLSVETLTGVSAADLTGGKLSGANLSRANLRSVILTNADLSGANLIETHLSYAQLRKAQLSSADLSGGQLRRADLTDADLTTTNLTGADLSGAILLGANLSGADLSGAIGLSQAQLDRACGTGVQGLPQDLTLDKPCPPPAQALPHIP
jgi:uncharacterized protein YjbI with pentapeptide repeats